MPPPKVNFGYGKCHRTIEVFENGMKAKRKNPNYDGVVYSAFPLKGEAEFEVKIITLGTRWSREAPRFGVAVDPPWSNLPSSSLSAENHLVWGNGGVEIYDRFQHEFATRKYGHFDLTKLDKGDNFGLRLNRSGDLTFFVNGVSQGVAAEYIYASAKGGDVYAVIDHFGRCDATVVTKAVTEWGEEVEEKKIVDKKVIKPEPRKSAFLQELPGVILSEPPRRVPFTSSGKEIDLKKEMGVAISIPRNAAFKDEQIDLTVSFSGAYKTPEDVTSVSPAYIIETSREVKDVEVKMQHTANIVTEEDQQNLTVMISSTHLEKDPVRKFEEIKKTNFECNSNYIKIKVKNFFSAIYKVVMKKTNVEKFYSARLYKSFTGIKVTAVLCVCLWHPIYTKHCDKVIAQTYPEVADKAKRTLFDGLVIKAHEIIAMTGSRNVTMDRSKILTNEINAPDLFNTDISKLDDYPPRIVINFSPLDQKLAPVVLNVIGMKTECSFSITNEHLPKVDTADLVAATKEFESESEIFSDSSNPLMTCAMNMVKIMTEVESLLHNRSSISTLVKKLGDIEELIKTVIKQDEGAKNVKASFSKVAAISHQFNKVAPAMKNNSAGNPDAWQGAVDVLKGNSINLMNAIKELLKATQAASVTSKGISIKYLNLIKCGRDRFQLVTLVSSRWDSFGTFLDIPEDQLESWKKEYLGDTAKCWNKVMGQWLSEGGTPDYPATWEGLYVLLEDMKYGQIAKELKEILKAKETKTSD